MSSMKDRRPSKPRRPKTPFGSILVYQTAGLLYAAAILCLIVTVVPEAQRGVHIAGLGFATAGHGLIFAYELRAGGVARGSLLVVLAAAFATYAWRSFRRQRS